MADFKAELERLELKYLIDEIQVESIREAIRPWCVADEHGFDSTEPGYLIDSLYLDSPSLACYRAREENAPHRFKLRVRHYGDGGPVHLEVKERHRDVCRKTRVAVRRDELLEAVRGEALPLEDSPWRRRQVDRFAALIALHGLEPRVLVRYRREAYQSEIDRYARVTFDRRMQAQPVEGWDLSGGDDGWNSLDESWHLDGLHSPVILELKCERQMPAWMAGIIRDHSLVRRGFSKYATGVSIALIAERGLDVPTGVRMLP